MPVALDWGLLVEDSTTPSENAYMKDILPKIQAFREIAMENARDSAERNAKPVNDKAVEPIFKAGDKVLLHNPVVKKGECTKLKRKYLGPFLIIECRPKHNYMLKELATGKEMKRPVHANRLRSLKELPNDYRLRVTDADVRLYESVTPVRNIAVTIRIGDIVYSMCDVIVSPANSGLYHGDGAAKAIACAAGDQLLFDCQEYVRVNEKLAIATPLLTASGLLGPTIKNVMHIVGPNMEDEPFASQPLLATTAVYNCFAACLKTADHAEGVTSIAIPAISAGIFGMDAWTVSGEALKALLDFDANSSDSGGGLNKIEFVCLDLLIADTMNVVFRQGLPPPQTKASCSGENDVVNDSLGEDEYPPVENIPASFPHDVDISDLPSNSVAGDSIALAEANTDNEWYTVKRVLKTKRLRGKDFYLVEWEDSPINSWVERKDLTDYALQVFYASRPPRRRRRRV